MLVFVIAVCIGILVGMAVGGIALTRNRQRNMSQTRARFDDLLAPTEPAGPTDVHPAMPRAREPGAASVDPNPAAELERAALSDAEQAAFNEITRQNFPEATD